MEFIDIKTQLEKYKEEIDSRMQKVMEHGRFIMGLEVTELEDTLSEYKALHHRL